ncbi:uncharacterized protein LOC127260421 [Andrographis paniculata]|uniref:uncharacterized protein LOC127260421 n=1 Tax=Andrographis paniculata TaxID=175694 RepID=UPI0021E71486|nr:uncharacterized protein LOC127260421 [Andrographis paniculata]
MEYEARDTEEPFEVSSPTSSPLNDFSSDKHEHIQNQDEQCIKVNSNPRHQDDNSTGGDAFVGTGFRTWNRSEAFSKHVCGIKSAHNQALGRLYDFKNQKSSVVSVLSKQSEQSASAYRLRLEASIECLKWHLLQGLAFRGHDESERSLNKGNFLELLHLLSVHNSDYQKVVLKNAPGNCQLIGPSIQKDIINACAKETTKAIIEELDGGFFSILVDESADIANKEQMALCLRYDAIESLLMEHSLSLSSVRGQGYDGASNMRGSINGLQTLILKESSSVYYVYCFAHQLQFTLAAVAQKNRDLSWLFNDVLVPLLNFVGGSPKRKEILREKQAEIVVQALSLGEIESGTGLNQELGLSRPGDTRWGSHFKTILNVIHLFPSILESLDAIGEVSDMKDKNKAESLTHLMLSFDFSFVAHLMLSIFGITNKLNLALQEKEQDIVNAMSMVDVTKKNLQDLRENGWDDFMEKVASFMVKHEVEILDMKGKYVIMGRRCYRGNKSPQMTNLHHFRVEVFLSVIDLQLQELENRFNKDLNELSMKLVETKKNETHSRVYLLLKLVLLLPVATATVERSFSAMTTIKNKLRNSMGDQLLNDCLVTFLERGVFTKVSINDIVNRYQNMRSRREQL